MDLGDAARWEVTPSVIGEDDSRTVVLVLRPTQPKLKTRLMVSTNRRLYSIFLASTDSADEAGDTRLYFQYPVRN
ncbi:Conjugal transfer protein [compost metagenome]